MTPMFVPAERSTPLQRLLNTTRTAWGFMALRATTDALPAGHLAVSY